MASKLVGVNAQDRAVIIQLVSSEKVDLWLNRNGGGVKAVQRAIEDRRKKLTKLENKLNLKYKHYV